CYSEIETAGAGACGGGECLTREAACDGGLGKI
ncbi:hypothetical protein F8388_008462, partial [Cannabis sativa]